MRLRLLDLYFKHILDRVVIQNRVPIERIVLKHPPDNAWHWWIYKAKILLFVLFILAFMALLYLK